MACLRTIATSRKADYGVKTVLALADYCHVTLTQPKWPAWKMCNLFTVTWTSKPLISWFGASCLSRCYFGAVKTQICDCIPGYWGETCNSVCPNGATHPCHDHGICSPKMGSCECKLNWIGSEDCSLCTPGFTGKELIKVITNINDF